MQGSTGGPDAEARAKSGSHIVAMPTTPPAASYEVHLTGVDGYTFTGRMLAWARTARPRAGWRERARSGPSTRFGLEELVRVRGGGDRRAGRAGAAPSPRAARRRRR